MTPAGHLLSGYLVGDAIGQGSPHRPWILGAALFGSIAPDLDVAVGLLGGWAGAGAHRGVTHSFLGAVAFAALVAVVSRKRFRLLFTACLCGVLTHVFWDWLNVWGVRPFWPWQASFRRNLLHEGDLPAAAIVAFAAICLWAGRRRAALLCLVTLVPAYLGLQLWRRASAREVAAGELPSSRTAVYPAPRLSCAWMVRRQHLGCLLILH
jgi:inner membrane protein